MSEWVRVWRAAYNGPSLCCRLLCEHIARLKTSSPHRADKDVCSKIAIYCVSDAKKKDKPLPLYYAIDSHPGSSVMDFIFCYPDSSHISVDTVIRSKVRSSSTSSPRWYTISNVCLPT